MARLIRAAGLRWPVEEDFKFSKDCFGLDQSQVRLYGAIARHTVLVMAALAICAVTAALLRDRTDTQAPPPVHPDQPPPADPGMTPLTVPEITRLLTTQPARPGLAEHWANWRRCHQARARWYHHRTRLAGDTTIPWSASEWVRQERGPRPDRESPGTAVVMQCDGRSLLGPISQPPPP